MQIFSCGCPGDILYTINVHFAAKNILWIAVWMLLASCRVEQVATLNTHQVPLSPQVLYVDPMCGPAPVDPLPARSQIGFSAAFVWQGQQWWAAGNQLYARQGTEFSLPEWTQTLWLATAPATDGVWVAAGLQGLWKATRTSGTWQMTRIFKDHVVAVTSDSGGQLWFATPKTIKIVDVSATPVITSEISAPSFVQSLRQREGLLGVAACGYVGLVRTSAADNASNWQWLDGDRIALDRRAVTDLYWQHEGGGWSLWLAAGDQGLWTGWLGEDLDLGKVISQSLWVPSATHSLTRRVRKLHAPGGNNAQQLVITGKDLIAQLDTGLGKQATPCLIDTASFAGIGANLGQEINTFDDQGRNKLLTIQDCWSYTLWTQTKPVLAAGQGKAALLGYDRAGTPVTADSKALADRNVAASVYTGFDIFAAQSTDIVFSNNVTGKLFFWGGSLSASTGSNMITLATDSTGQLMDLVVQRDKLPQIVHMILRTGNSLSWLSIPLLAGYASLISNASHILYVPSSDDLRFVRPTFGQVFVTSAQSDIYNQQGTKLPVPGNASGRPDLRGARNDSLWYRSASRGGLYLLQQDNTPVLLARDFPAKWMTGNGDQVYGIEDGDNLSTAQVRWVSLDGDKGLFVLPSPVLGAWVDHASGYLHLYSGTVTLDVKP